MKSVNPADIVQGIRFRFVDVFGNSQGMAVADSKDDAVQYYVVDTYCMNPDCRCDEVYLQFIKNNEQIKNKRADFTILFSVGTKGYEFKGVHGISEKEADEVVKKEVKKSKEMIELLKQRYKKMKQAGREVLQIDKGTVDKLPGKAKRNEPCPCGSGKKYKKCCGA